MIMMTVFNPKERSHQERQELLAGDNSRPKITAVIGKDKARDRQHYRGVTGLSLVAEALDFLI